MGLDFVAGGPFWGSIVVPVVCFWGSIVVRVVRFGAPFWCRWFVLRPRFGWCSVILGRCVLGIHFGDRFWCRWSVLGLHFPGPRFWTSSGFGGLRFWTSSGFGPALASGGSFLNLRWLPGARFWAPKFVPGPSRPTISESPYICVKSSNHPLFASLAFVFPFAPPSLMTTYHNFKTGSKAELYQHRPQIAWKGIINL